MKKLFALLMTIVISMCAGACAYIQVDNLSDQTYQEKRGKLEKESQYQTEVKLSDKEEILDKKLDRWKEEYINSCDGKVPYDMPVLTDENIWDSTLYGFCRSLPKGSDLHVHGAALLPFDELLAFVISRNDLYIGTGESNRYVLACHVSPDEVGKDELTVQEALEQGIFSTEELKEQWTVIGGTQYEDIWEWFEMLFARQMALSATPDLIEAYYKEALRYYAENNILHLEIRQLFFGTHEDAATNAKAIRNAYYEVRKEYPGFIVSLVGTGLKYTTLDRELTDQLLDNSLYVYENVKEEFEPDNTHDFLIAIDLVNEEDKSRPLAEYADQIDQIVKKYPDIHLVLHAGESLYASSDNIIDAYLVGSDRIGHGLNLYRFPEVMDMVREDGICLEICPVSNQTLRYVSDLRSHPATEYLKRGVPICLSSDDPSYQEHETLTDDFFAAIVCWDLGVAEIKQLCMNSVKYSCVDDTQKDELMKNWEDQWNTFLDYDVDKSEEEDKTAALDSIKKNGVLRVGTAGDYQPMSYLDPSKGTYVGFDAELAEDLAEALDVDIEYVKTSWPTLMEDTLAGKFDLAICGITITDARKEQALMSEGYLKNGKTVLCRAEDADKYTSLESINHPGVHVMENPGGLNEKFARENLPDATLIIHDVNQEIPGLVASGEADVMITEIMEAGFYVGQDSRLAAPLIYEPFTNGQLGVLMPKGSEDLLEYVNEFLEKEKADGRIDELSEKYIYHFTEEEQNNAA